MFMAAELAVVPLSRGRVRLRTAGYDMSAVYNCLACSILTADPSHLTADPSHSTAVIDIDVVGWRFGASILSKELCSVILMV